ncbi:Arylsulfatase [Pontiella desulfatans]|uniref:Arylsulfatase n=1 Tax=Pontiella desulfatans TaxID=2750659 RepID=A0A6C2U5D8_PONDE|nr:sulfatase-like hydrolase/transferase [Pontiella desulfatans]SPS73949.1 sulfatase S1_N.C [Kiritimatiellales bacterium]VGO15093.1 Arylsulfatase [Pontiella desulfatans]
MIMEIKRPNLLFIMTDQHRFDALGANGNDVVQTSNLDALALSGANVQGYFTNAPVCVPSRCTLFTGRYPHSHCIRENYNFLEAGREIHLFRVLKQAGYKIGYCGKNHLLDAQEFENFDYTGYMDDSPRATAETTLHEKYIANSEALGVPFGKHKIWRTGLVHDEPKDASRAWLTAQAGAEFLKQQDGQDPFALCVSFKDPHVPHMALREYYDCIDQKQIKLYPSETDDERALKARRWAIKRAAFHAEEATAKDIRHYIAVYYAMIGWVDTQIGELLETLREQGLEQNTLIVFTSDHGDFNFEHGLAKKDLVLVDSLLRVPLMVSWPGRIQPKTLNETFVEEVDIMPTLLELLEIETPVGVQGTSFAPLLRGETAMHKDAVFAEACPPYLYNKYPDYEAFAAAHGGRDYAPFNVPGDFNKSIREKDFRYTWYGTGEEELYDHRTDPHELNNLADDPAYADEKNRLKLRLLEWNALTEDPLDPNLRRDLQEQYSNWNPLPIQPGHHYSPLGKETIHMKLAKPV